MNNRKRTSNDLFEFETSVDFSNKKPAVSQGNESDLFDLFSDLLDTEAPRQLKEPQLKGKDSTIAFNVWLDRPVEPLRSAKEFTSQDGDVGGWNAAGAKLIQHQNTMHPSRALASDGMMAGSGNSSPLAAPYDAPTEPGQKIRLPFLCQTVPTAANLIETLFTDDDDVFGYHASDSRRQHKIQRTSWKSDVNFPILDGGFPVL